MDKPAFPFTEHTLDGEILDVHKGLTRRELIAAMTLGLTIQMCLHAIDTGATTNGTGQDGALNERDMAEQAVIFADALCAALDAEPQS